MSTLYRRIKLKDCGSTWCDQYVGCRGHVIDASYQNTSDVGMVYVDGKYAFGGGDSLMDACGDIVADLWADEPKYYITEKEWKEENHD